VSPGATHQVQAAYQWILGRDADAYGYEHFGSALDAGTMDGHALRNLLIQSPEFRSSAHQLLPVQVSEGVVVIVDPNEPEFGSYVARHGGWKGQIVKTIVDLLPESGVFIDVGANVGIMSFNAARKVGPSGKVISFEPNPLNVANFRRGMLANSLDNVLLYPLALSDRQQILTTSATSNAKVRVNTDPMSLDDVVQAVPADTLLAQEGRVDLVKIDIEGYELFALKGMDKTLQRLRPLVLCEFNPLCLRHEGQIDPAVLAEYIFTMTSQVDIVEADCALTRISSAVELMDLWRQRDAEAVATGRLPSGAVHFDLLYRAY
jgi:FkbM family methyltransferase